MEMDVLKQYTGGVAFTEDEKTNAPVDEDGLPPM
jgi:hypothetical protein